MNQLDYQSTSTPSSFPSNNQPISQPAYAQYQQAFDGQQQFHAASQNGMFQQNAPYPANAFNPNLTQNASPQQPPLKYPMAAPPLPQTPVNTAVQQNVSTPNTPQSPNVDQKESERIQLLLEINAELFQEIISLQDQGKGGAINAQQKAQNGDGKMASEDYIHTLRRLQANLGYVSSKTSSQPAKHYPGPPLMTPPPHMPQLRHSYEKLMTLFPGWTGNENRNMAGRTQQQAVNGTSA